jgi:flavin-dependent dehydrogenase
MRPLRNICEVAVIGGGLAGLSAARHAVRLGRLATLFEVSGLCRTRQRQFQVQVE